MPAWDKSQEAAVTEFCRKYITLMEVLYKDKELNAWCSNYSAYKNNTVHVALEKIIYQGFMKEAYHLKDANQQKIMPDIHKNASYSSYSLEKALAGNHFDLAFGIFLEIRCDYGTNGSLIYDSIAKGNLYRLMSAFLDKHEQQHTDSSNSQHNSTNQKVYGGQAYSLEYIKSRENCPREKRPGGRTAVFDKSMNQWRMQIQLDEKGIWFLSVIVNGNGNFIKYCLDKETAEDSNYEFTDEMTIRKKYIRWETKNCILPRC